MGRTAVIRPTEDYGWKREEETLWEHSDRIKKQGLTLRGTEYTATFQGEQKEEAYRYSGMTGERHNYWWEGTAVIRKKNGKEIKVAFRTSKDKFFSLEEAVVKFTARHTSWPSTPDMSERTKRQLVDLIVESMHKEVLRRKRENDFSSGMVGVPSVDIDWFTNKYGSRNGKLRYEN